MERNPTVCRKIEKQRNPSDEFIRRKVDIKTFWF